MFVTLEGIDRSGKSTQAALLAGALGADALLVREPGGTPAGERIRALLKDPELELAPLTELLLFASARAELCASVIAPALVAGRDVVCDRFADSTLVYQGIARGLEAELVATVNAEATAGLAPDLTILVRVDPELAARRGQARLDAGGEDGSDRFESEGLEFQRRIAAAYDELARSEPNRIVVVDGSGDPAAVHERVMAAVADARD